MRHHGWELPYHPLQVTAVAVFMALGFAFYIFFVPFVECTILETCGLIAYSVTVLVVCALYTWCVAADPAVVSVMRLKTGGPSANGLADLEIQAKLPAQGYSCSLFGFSGIDSCLGDVCFQTSGVQDLSPESRKLFCSLCKIEISMRTKHCRVCDKCVDEFDHHCQWLNNCIGKRNYRGFVVLLVATLVMFTLQWFFGLWILVHRFLREAHYESVIFRKLGRSFPSLGYLFVLVFCTVVAMVATCLLGQLIFFHVVLIKKGVTTYEYIMSKRNKELEAERECRPSSLMSGATSSAGPSSAIVNQPKAVEPTLLDHEPRGEIRSLKLEKDLGGSWTAFSQRFSTRKTSVKVNPWHSSFMQNEEDEQIASTPIHKLSTGQPATILTERESSFGSSQGFSADLIASFGIGGASRRFSEVQSNGLDELILSTWQNGKLPLDPFEQLDSSENNSGTSSQVAGKRLTLNPLQREARNVFRSSHSFCSSEVSVPAFGGATSSEAVDIQDVEGPLEKPMERGETCTGLKPATTEALKSRQCSRKDMSDIFKICST